MAMEMKCVIQVNTFLYINYKYVMENERCTTGTDMSSTRFVYRSPWQCLQWSYAPQYGVEHFWAKQASVGLFGGLDFIFGWGSLALKPKVMH